MPIQTDCGIFGTVSTKYIQINTILDGLSKLQHRGRDCYGISLINNEKIEVLTFSGSVNTNTNTSSVINSLSWLGHLRYATSGAKDIDTILLNCQPFLSRNGYAIAHNGNIPQSVWNVLADKYNDKYYNSSSTDTKKLIHFIDYLISNSSNIDWLSIIKNVLNEIPYAYSIAIQTNKGDTWLFKDRFGIRPMTLVKCDDCCYFSSESVAFDDIDFSKLEDVLPGEIINITPDINIFHHQGITSVAKQCVFEWIYFLRGDTIINKVKVDEFRVALGKCLSEQLKNKTYSSSGVSLSHWFLENNALVCGVPSSGVIYGKRLAYELGLEYNQFIEKKTNMRTFILENNDKRIKACKEKYNIEDCITNKVIVIVDDSIVRGNTMKYLIKYIRSFSPKQIHLVSGCPPIARPCHYGVDFADIEELIINRIPDIKDLEKELDVDSLTYLNQNDLDIISNKMIGGVCNGCMTNTYLD